MSAVEAFVELPDEIIAAARDHLRAYREECKHRCLHGWADDLAADAALESVFNAFQPHMRPCWLSISDEVVRLACREFYNELHTHPSDAMRAAIAAALQGMKLAHGPYGYLVIPSGLNEEHWRLESDPEPESDCISIPLFASSDPFNLVSPGVSGDTGPNR